MTEEALGQHHSPFYLSTISTVVQSQKRRCAMDLADSPTPHLEAAFLRDPRNCRCKVGEEKISESGCDRGAVQGHPRHLLEQVRVGPRSQASTFISSVRGKPFWDCNLLPGWVRLGQK